VKGALGYKGREIYNISFFLIFFFIILEVFFKLLFSLLLFSCIVENKIKQIGAQINLHIYQNWKIIFSS